LPALAISPLPEHLGVRLWLIDLHAPPDADHWQACSPDEHARAARFRFPQHARRYQAAHVAMRQTLASALNVAPASIHWREGTHGKPHLLGHEGWHFNLSHSHDWALLGLHHGAPIGVDLEWCADTRDLPSLAAHNFTAAEQGAMARADTAEQVPLFYRVWSRKEACLKALGSGLSIAPQHFEAGVQAEALSTFIPTSQGPFAMQVCSVSLPVAAMAAVAVLAPGCTQTAW
jgi:4'-phosphopantetheinyl transferase